MENQLDHGLTHPCPLCSDWPIQASMSTSFSRGDWIVSSFVALVSVLMMAGVHYLFRELPRDVASHRPPALMGTADRPHMP